MTVVSLQDLENNPRGLIERVEGGESLIVTRDGAPIAELRPTKKRDPSPRPSGLAKGQFTVPEAFFDPLPEDILRGFEGS